MPQPTKYFLSKVSFVDSSAEIVLEFSSNSSKRISRFPFSPRFYFSKKSNISSELLSQVLFSINISSVVVEEFEAYFSISSPSFSDLKKFSKILLQSINISPLLIEPERQFLIEKNWSFFDCFVFPSSDPIKVNSIVFPNAFFDFINSSFSSHLSKLVSSDTSSVSSSSSASSSTSSPPSKSSSDFLSLVFWSNFLKLPIDSIPSALFVKSEIFLENLFFKNRFFVLTDSSNSISSADFFSPKGFFENVVELDFSLVWSEFFSLNFFNLGFESINCSCCKPSYLTDKNILPSSFVNVKFSKNAFFFNSLSKDFANSFHKTFPFKESRVRRKSEFYLSHHPIGPFFKNDSYSIPLFDAFYLFASDEASFVSFDSLFWSCNKNSSFLSNEFSDLISLMNSLSSSISDLVSSSSSSSSSSFSSSSNSSFFNSSSSSNSLFSSQSNSSSLRSSSQSNSSFSNSPLFSSFSLDSDPVFLFFSNFKSSLESFIRFFISHLTDSRSRFYYSPLANAILSLRLATLSSFKLFAEENGAKLLSSSFSRVFLLSPAPLKLSQEFSSSNNLPSPSITRFIKSISFY